MCGLAPVRPGVLMILAADPACSASPRRAVLKGLSAAVPALTLESLLSTRRLHDPAPKVAVVIQGNPDLAGNGALATATLA